MKFLQSCYIRKNNIELILKLKELGYQCNPYLGFNILATHFFYKGLAYSYESDKYLICNGSIDCGINENLFLAIAALRDDSDIHQFFVNNRDEWILSNRDKFFSQQHLNTEDELNEIKTLDYFILTESHKATVEELIEHFKK